MMVTINNLILREYKLDLANKTHQLKALQAQINPHFLYNTLQSIGTLALQHEVPRIYSLLSPLAKMLRYNMRDHTVDEEPDSSEQDSIGLRNVLLRIQLHSEDGANTLSVDNMVPHGVRYTLEIRTKAHTGIQIKGE
ncbi:sensor histidine kinase [Paenibacillus farraposensis]|nr:histidine kinase [Paenibacillus farraposensis]